SPVLAGNNLTYTITVANAGPSDAQAVSFTDALPAGTTFVSDATTSGPAFTFTNPPVGSNGTVGGTLATLAAGQSSTFTIVVKVGADVADNTPLSNTASASSATADPNGLNNSATNTTTVHTLADLQVTKSGPATVIAGTDLTYTIGLSNAGPSDAHNLMLSDAVPAN